jgi:hypothetical protein
VAKRLLKMNALAKLVSFEMTPDTATLLKTWCAKSPSSMRRAFWERYKRRTHGEQDEAENLDIRHGVPIEIGLPWFLRAGDSCSGATRG